ncbi:MAG: DUF2889 domain-containing protein [Syntrophales bacterium]|nr:DUF2889 domain-containing protein [Syntrophales bacterium]MCK9528627.1 DUF2889 domain-containing protein [Syntrophales bacterium]MDX9923068.1 DUF2889 domain-containing protein [Syntrophales bacterium]
MTFKEAPPSPVHRRSIEVETFEHGATSLLVVGRLRDNRFNETRSFGGTVFPPGIVHDMIIRLIVRRSDMTIESIDVEMPRTPRDECLEAQNSLDLFRGTRIERGFTDRVRASAGKGRGCTHLASLFLAMGSAAVQGAWSAMAERPLRLKDTGEAACALLEDTCLVWRSGGPAMKQLLERIDQDKALDDERPVRK